jgi:hypothetical protein
MGFGCFGDEIIGGSCDGANGRKQQKAAESSRKQQKAAEIGWFSSVDGLWLYENLQLG